MRPRHRHRPRLTALILAACLLVVAVTWAVGRVDEHQPTKVLGCQIERATGANADCNQEPTP